MKIIYNSLLTALLFLFTFGATQAQEIYFEDFENAVDTFYEDSTVGLDGLPDWDFTTSVEGLGRLRTFAGSNFPKNGSRAVTLDVNTDASYAQNYLILRVDMSGQTTSDSVWLNFWVMDHDEETDLGDDVVEVRGSDTDPWVQLYQIDGAAQTSGQYYHITGLNISQAISGAGQSYTSSFQVRFGQYDNYIADNITSTDGLTFDDVKIYIPSAKDVGVTDIVTPNPSVGRKYTSSELDSIETVTVDVYNFGMNDQTNVPVNFQVDNDSIARDTIASINSGQTVTFTFTPTADLWDPGKHSLDAWTSLSGDADSTNDNDNQEYWQIPNDSISLPFHELFDVSMEDTFYSFKRGLDDLLHQWDYDNNSADGRIRLHSKYAKSEPYAVTMDEFATNTNWLTLTLNMDRYDVNVDTNIMLFFSYLSHGDESNIDDIVEVRGNEFDTWIKVYDLAANIDTHGAYMQVDSIDIDSFLSLGGQNFTKSFQVRFGQSDNNPADTINNIDGFSFDNVLIATSAQALGQKEPVVETPNVKVYPNPTSGEFQLNVKGAQDKAQTQVNIYRVDGSMVYHRQFESAHPLQKRINLADEPDGLYIIRVQTAEQVVTRKLMKH